MKRKQKASRHFPKGPPLWKQLLVVIVVSLITLMLEHMGIFRRFETASLDQFFILRRQQPVQHVAIVAITEDDYQQPLFGEQSPLNAGTIQDLIKKISQYNPKVIGVDLDTSAKTFRDIQVPPSPPIIWARDAILQTEDKEIKDLLNPFSEAEDVFVPDKVLGSSQPLVLSGIALMPVDFDSNIRRYQRRFTVVGGKGDSNTKQELDSFHWAIVKTYCRQSGDTKGCREVEKEPHEGAGPPDQHEKELALNLSIEPYSLCPIPASVVLLGDAKTQTSCDGSASQTLKERIEGKIVLLGGHYRAARDEHYTPVGTRFGVDLMAQAIESELEGPSIHHANEWIMLGLEVIAGLILVFLNYFFPHRWPSLTGLILIPVLAITCSFIAFSSSAMWASFIPVLVAVRLHYAYDRRREFGDAIKELEEYHIRIKTLEERLAFYESREKLPDEDSK